MYIKPLFSFKGRIGRLEWFAIASGATLVCQACWLASFFLDKLVPGWPLALLASVLLLWLTSCAAAKRLHDLGRRGRWLGAELVASVILVICAVMLNPSNPHVAAAALSAEAPAQALQRAHLSAALCAALLVTLKLACLALLLKKGQESTNQYGEAGSGSAGCV